MPLGPPFTLKILLQPITTVVSPYTTDKSSYFVEIAPTISGSILS
jgi:hypothetical protein